MITVKGKYDNGIQVAHDIIFPKDIQPTRNHLYTITLEPLDIPTDYGMVTHSIRVRDWDTGETLAFSAQDLLNNPKQPDFEITTTTPTTGTMTIDPSGKTKNITTLTLSEITTSEPIEVKVTSHRGTAAKLFCVDDDLTDLNLPTGIKIVESPTKTYNENSQLVQTFTITVDPLAATGSKSYTIVVEDFLNDSAAKRTFTLTNTKS